MGSYIDPTKERYALFKGLPRDSKIHMLNLVQLNDTAQYQDGTLVTGREAYSAYGRESGPIFEGLGGRIVWSGNFDLMLIGPEDRKWDICFIAEYPNGEAFISMLRDPMYRAAVVHRQVAVKDSRLIRLSPQEDGKWFG
jgi:uncharacterized protein (DUF1330 family)